MKQKLKKSTALAISFVMIFLLAGCKNGDDEKTSKEEKKNEVSADYGYNVDYKELFHGKYSKIRKHNLFYRFLL